MSYINPGPREWEKDRQRAFKARDAKAYAEACNKLGAGNIEDWKLYIRGHKIIVAERKGEKPALESISESAEGISETVMPENYQTAMAFLVRVEGIGRGSGVAFKYATRKRAALRELGITSLEGFGDLGDLDIRNVAVKRAIDHRYETEIARAEYIVSDYEAKRR